MVDHMALHITYIPYIIPYHIISSWCLISMHCMSVRLDQLVRPIGSTNRSHRLVPPIGPTNWLNQLIEPITCIHLVNPFHHISIISHICISYHMLPYYHIISLHIDLYSSLSCPSLCSIAHVMFIPPIHWYHLLLCINTQYYRIILIIIIDTISISDYYSSFIVTIHFRLCRCAD